MPPTAVKLSDLAGGVYGPGASVASTGFNSQRPVVKAVSSRTAGDTWEDVLEYYMVRMGAVPKVVLVTQAPFSSMPTGEKRILRTDLGRSIIRVLCINHLEVLPQEAKASVFYTETMNVRCVTSCTSPGRSGPLIHLTCATSHSLLAKRPAKLGSLQLVPRISGGCF